MTDVNIESIMNTNEKLTVSLAIAHRLETQDDKEEK